MAERLHHFQDVMRSRISFKQYFKLMQNLVAQKRLNVLPKIKLHFVKKFWQKCDIFYISTANPENVFVNSGSEDMNNLQFTVFVESNMD